MIIALAAGCVAFNEPLARLALVAGVEPGWVNGFLGIYTTKGGML